MVDGTDAVRGDLATIAARFGAALHAAGLPVGPDRSERFTRAVLIARPRTTTELRRCALATLVSDPDQRPAFDAVFAAVFERAVDPADDRGDPNSPTLPNQYSGPANVQRGQATSASVQTGSETGNGPRMEAPLRALASGMERLAARDFAELTPDELLLLSRVMRALRVATPPRRSHRQRKDSHGRRVDLRTTLRQARRSGGDPLRLVRRSLRERPRKLVALCDISGSMEPYARALLQLLFCAAGGAEAEVFTFATRLTRLTPLVRKARPDTALERAGAAAPDWSGGTRIGAAIREFNETYGLRGMARGAVVLIVSDGWDTGDPALLKREMARLSRVVYRIVWANPRTQSAEYRPLVRGMEAAWPYCDAIVSAHRLDALDDLLAALHADRTAFRRDSFRA